MANTIRDVYALVIDQNFVSVSRTWEIDSDKLMQSL